ncbi:DUF3313 family protein [Vibrio methylphosphonaticus]|uniref:DUF3313 family protein n=1 Tax=Vibrio methylphosphonaticus TaxID=2946866 RepID=UPI00202A7613|nr:DUF3313 family protein [Vibrio methylphosphonaticus]MCL9773799.1 DUF3313 domain-containing protein [Vibrio methylphosphonaticus]
MRTLIIMGLIATLTACSAVSERSKHNDFTYQVNANTDSWRYVWLPAEYSDQTLLKEKFSTYSNFYIEPTRLEVQDSEFSEQELREFADYLESEAQITLTRYKVPAFSPQANGLTVQFAISNVATPNSILATTSSVLPIGLAISYASMLTTGEHTNVTTARIEVLISDSQTKEPLFSAIDITAGEKSLDNILEPEEEIKNILRGWVNKLEQTLNQIPENAK